ncbi:MAG: ferrous iron transport protein B [Candidatus Bipolaricaulota bacterium]|nr:ferrous iron transport protein B [Candidatus Bipolaricaulota bacterium]
MEAERAFPRRVALVGQPNAGKSTLFNAIVGYRAVAANFPGTTVEALRGRARAGRSSIELVDLPGTYSLLGGDPAERVAREFLLAGEADAVVHVADASRLDRSLELTLELAELGLPAVLCLNMADEAEHRGVRIDREGLSSLLGVPVVVTVASRGQGIPELLAALPHARPIQRPPYPADVERALRRVISALPPGEPFPVHRAARLLAGEEPPGALRPAVEEAWAELAPRGEDPALVLSDARHAAAARLFEAVAQVGKARVGWRERADDLVMGPVLGYPLLLLVLLGLFASVYGLGSALERLLAPGLDALSGAVHQALGTGLAGSLLRGAWDGLAAGVAVVLPYLAPFLLLLAFLEDVGYLPRAGFLLDGLMHRVGLHGKSVIPFLLGYGCTVPAVLATRILEEERDRILTAALAVLVPCAGRTIVILGLVGRYVGPWAALLLYLGNLLVIALAGWALARLVPSESPGLVLEIPPYRLPRGRNLLGKTWLRLRGFVLLAWPLLAASSALLTLLEALGWNQGLNLGLRFLTWPLGLPAEAGVPLVLGVLRKELSLVMLAGALPGGVGALTVGQRVVFTVFVLFYVPCLATVGALGRELGWRRTGLVVVGTTGLGLVLALLVRGVLRV